MLISSLPQTHRKIIFLSLPYNYVGSCNQILAKCNVVRNVCVCVNPRLVLKQFAGSSASVSKYWLEEYGRCTWQCLGVPRRGWNSPMGGFFPPSFATEEICPVELSKCFPLVTWINNIRFIAIGFLDFK